VAFTVASFFDTLAGLAGICAAVGDDGKEGEWKAEEQAR